MTPRKKLATRIYDAIFPPKQKAQRSYAAARLTKGNMNWDTQPTGANFERRVSLDALRARARQTSRDNGHIKKFLSLTRSNVIGPKGIQLQVRARTPRGKLNVKLNQRVEEAWWQWSHRETCTQSGRLDWIGIQRLIATQLACDGEFLVQKIKGVRGNPFGFALKVWDVNWLDTNYTEALTNGNRIIMSVEIDANDRPVAYHLTTPASEMNFTRSRSRQRMRIPAEDMIHGFLVHDDESQVRGVTWFHAALLNTKNYQGYEEGVIQSARMYSNIPLFLENTSPDGEEYTGAETDEGERTNPAIDVSALAVNALPPGWKMSQFDPKQPTQQHSQFAKTVLMGLAAALDVPYFYLAGDMEAVNFSSSRVGLDDARDIWKGIQDFVATTFCRNVYHAWAYEAMLSGKLTLTGTEFAEIQDPVWRARGWKYIDPTKDIAADVERLKYRLATPSEILAEQGTDYTDFLERWQADKELAADYDIDIEEIYSEPVPQAAAPSEPEEKKATDDEANRTVNVYTNGKYSDAGMNWP